MIGQLVTLARGAGILAVASLLAACEPPPVDSVQRGYRGTGMVEVYRPATVAAAAAINTPPPPSPALPSEGPKAGQIYKNVKVLGDLSLPQFTQAMVNITAWVSPQQGCAYCHTPGQDFSDDSLYAKVVSRRMFQMTQHVNASWKQHVAETGVTCYTCHRGQPVPANIWFRSPDVRTTTALVGNRAGQNAPSMNVGLASLPNDPFSLYQLGGDEIRVISPQALPDGSKPSLIKATEATYGLMMHMSQSLGVNCTYCHNSRSFGSWEMSTPQRVTAYHGIRLTRDLNSNYMGSLAGVFPPDRLGPTGDVPKLNCATCHQGAYKPLYGANISEGHPGMRSGVNTAPAAADAASGPSANSVAPEPPAPGPGPSAAQVPEAAANVAAPSGPLPGTGVGPQAAPSAPR